MKPCPWCGGKVGPIVEEGSTFRWRRVTGCCVDGPEVRHDTLADDQDAAKAASDAAAIDAWNSRPVEDTLRAQLEAAEAEWREKFEARTIDWSEASNALYVWRHRAKDAEARAEAAEADAARYRWLREGNSSMKWEVVDCRDPAFPISRRKEPLDAAIDAAIARTKEQQA